MGIEYERLPWCFECEGFAVPTDAGVCGECGTEVVFRDAEELREQRRRERDEWPGKFQGADTLIGEGDDGE